MVANRRVYDSHHLQADCQELGSAPELLIRAVIEYGLPFFTILTYVQNYANIVSIQYS